MLVNIVVAIQILAAIAMAGLVLVQHGKGADMGAAFGSGTAGGLFGSSGSANFLSRMTAVSATVFFASTLGLAFLAGHGLRQPSGSDTSVLENAPFVAPVNESGAVSAIPGAAPAPAAEPAEAVNPVPAASEAIESDSKAEQVAPAQDGGSAAQSAATDSAATAQQQTPAVEPATQATTDAQAQSTEPAAQ